MRQTILILPAIALLTFSACASANYRKELTTSDAGPTANSSAGSTANTSILPASTPAASDKAVAKPRQQVNDSLVKVSDGQAATESTGAERKIIRNAELTIETQNSEESFRRVSSLAEAKGGFVVTSEATQPE